MDITNREAFAVREFCARYGICRDTFYEEVRRGRLRALKLGKKTIVLKVDAESWAKSLPALQPAAGVLLPSRGQGVPS
jgi:excisionase family DNA binding protein